MSKTIPEKYRNTIWDLQVLVPEDGAFVFASPDDEFQPDPDDETIIQERSGVFMSFTPDTIENLRPLIFPSKIYAELYRQFLLDQDPDHEIKTQVIKFMERLPTDAGYFLQQKFGVCPRCGKMAQYGNAATNEFFCEACGAPFDAAQPKTESE